MAERENGSSKGILYDPNVTMQGSEDDSVYNNDLCRLTVRVLVGLTVKSQ
jgi:hypothetical protein